VPLYQPHALGCTVSDNWVRCTSAFGQILVRLYHFISHTRPDVPFFDFWANDTQAFQLFSLRLYRFLISGNLSVPFFKFWSHNSTESRIM
ncbi:MAG: hypothetical protein WAP56_10925, partial [Acetivibrionales bacterium]